MLLCFTLCASGLPVSKCTSSFAPYTNRLLHTGIHIHTQDPFRENHRCCFPVKDMWTNHRWSAVQPQTTSVHLCVHLGFGHVFVELGVNFRLCNLDLGINLNICVVNNIHYTISVRDQVFTTQSVAPPYSCFPALVSCLLLSRGEERRGAWAVCSYLLQFFMILIKLGGACPPHKVSALFY